MTTDITVFDTKNCTLSSPTGNFNVTYITAKEDGKTYTVYESTKGYQLVVPNARLTLHYKENTKDGRTFCNCYAVSPQSSTPKTTGEKVLETLRNIEEQLQQVLANMNSNTCAKPVSNSTTDPATNDGLPF